MLPPALMAETAYPPYNIERLGDNEYRITMAVAGFNQSELKIDAKESLLSVRGEKAPEPAERKYLASGYRDPLVRAPVPARRLCRGQVRGFGRWRLEHRSRAQPAGAP